MSSNARLPSTWLERSTLLSSPTCCAYSSLPPLLLPTLRLRLLEIWSPSVLEVSAKVPAGLDRKSCPSPGVNPGGGPGGLRGGAFAGSMGGGVKDGPDGISSNVERAVSTHLDSERSSDCFVAHLLATEAASLEGRLAGQNAMG
eukprot:CAMPEP_0169191434 /NCGR_PEP_ID=MMETSP1016-20121227/5073_1 /TAXON_ID=342587 /ORGANISM="Karlodinium micrum, Strain CCMP2283" /LENGTH=143 /DNA_ID=CAMNT_0009267695 /DNA_START=782 /DNA_END=1213 /DNA_ORIENTATION=+